MPNGDASASLPVSCHPQWLLAKLLCRTWYSNARRPLHLHIDGRLVKKTLDQLTPEDSRPFCFQDCALYVTNERGSHGFWRQQLLDKIYRTWYPTRSQDTDISHKAFFCHLMEICTASTPVSRPNKDVLGFHLALCVKLAQTVPSIAQEISLVWPRFQTYEGLLLAPAAEYKLRPSFKECFIIIHTDPYEHHSYIFGICSLLNPSRYLS